MLHRRTFLRAIPLVALGVQQALASIYADEKPDLTKIYGRIQWVEAFPDYKVQVVAVLPDLRVQRVTSGANKVGLWEEVTSNPDFKLQRVDSFPDFRIQYVEQNPGIVGS